MTMRLFSVRSAALAVAVAIAITGCDNGPETTPTTPTLPTLVTETFEGALTINGAVTHAFSTAGLGTVTTTATTLAPSDAKIGLALGTWNGVACQIIIANDNAVQGTVVTGTVAAAGSLCTRIYDAAGTLAGNVTYTLTVVHP